MTFVTDNRLQHRTVLLGEAVSALVRRADGVYVDGTFGCGGHSRAILAKLTSAGRLIAFDRDPQAIAMAGKIGDQRFESVYGSFGMLRNALAGRSIEHVSGVLLDLGVSSLQFNTPQRGFSFRADGPLDMRMDPSRGQSAADWLAWATLQELTGVIRDYGEERFAFQISKALVARRAESYRLGPLVSTRELAQIVANVVKTREKGKDPATRTFQAIRIHINQELIELQTVLEATLSLLEQGGRLVVISFHSLEDRIVKRFMQTHANISSLDYRYSPIRAADFPKPSLKRLNRIFPGKEEVTANPHARSAVMRIAERCSP